MKKIISAISIIAVTALCMTACGNENHVVLEQTDDAYHVFETEPATTLRKVKPVVTDTTATAAADSEDSTDSSETALKSTDKAETTDTVAESTAAASPEDSTDGVQTSDNSAENSDNQDNSAAEADEYYLEGIVYKKIGKGILLNEKDMQLITVSFKEDSTADTLNVGDKVLITYNGEIMESYPAQTHNAYGVKVTEKAEHTYKVQHFVCDNEAVSTSFSILVPDKWTITPIDYPTEGEFTDWGFRIIPEGETTGLDISWHSAFSVREPYDVFPVTINGNKVEKYGANGNWRFYAYNNGYIAANNFYGTSLYDEYSDDFEFILSTLIFDQNMFIGE
ncbi:MAG: DUF3221 domain-containing protein [Ruminococcus sp.]|nr:DUF3221 domain-containing protein [Ruminococcus sp.]